jgi:hypothetical protein
MSHVIGALVSGLACLFFLRFIRSVSISGSLAGKLRFENGFVGLFGFGTIRVFCRRGQVLYIAGERGILKAGWFSRVEDCSWLNASFRVLECCSGGVRLVCCYAYTCVSSGSTFQGLRVCNPYVHLQGLTCSLWHVGLDTHLEYAVGSFLAGWAHTKAVMFTG